MRYTRLIGRLPTPLRRFGAAALLLLMLATMLSACASEGATSDDSGLLDAIIDDPTAYLGQQVTLEGRIGELYGPNAFRVEQDSAIEPVGDGLLVVVAEGAVHPDDLSPEMDIQLTGQLRPYNPAEIEQQLGASFQPLVQGISEGDPLLLAERITLRATVSDLDDDPGAYLGTQVTVIGEVAEMVREGIFRLEGPASLGGGDLLVTMADVAPTVAVSAGDTVVVTGEVRQFMLQELEEDLELDLDSGLFAGWENRAVIMADTITVQER